MPDLDDLSAWHYDLPAELIASRPAAQRDAARLMVIERRSQQIRHQMIRELPELLNSGDLLVFNNTRVLPARLFGCRTSTGGRWEGLFVAEMEPGTWILLGETRGRPLAGETITIRPAYSPAASVSPTAALKPTGAVRPAGAGESLLAKLLEKQSDGSWLVELNDRRPAAEILDQYGSLPLPPYMGRRLADEQDQQRYQTAFASRPGAVAAPTAGLHFTPELLRCCRESGVGLAELTLHVGIGTFRPVSSSRLSEHQMHQEWAELPSAAGRQLAETRDRGGRIVAVGTTCVRTLESAAQDALNHPATGQQEWRGYTDLFIRPGHQFRSVDCLLTNFHLPGSTLIVLAAALAGYDLIMEAYRQAIQQRYRFYSYGDAMLIL